MLIFLLPLPVFLNMLYINKDVVDTLKYLFFNSGQKTIIISLPEDFRARIMTQKVSKTWLLVNFYSQIDFMDQENTDACNCNFKNLYV